MKRIPTFVAGMLTAAVIGGLGVGALAASGAVTFNASNLMFNGQQISAKGEGYTLDNGCQAPASITYTDEKDGGTTYLPVRRISELLDVEIGWDGATGSVTVGKTADTTAIPADYSDWSEEEEAAYQEFKGMWEIRLDSDSNSPYINLYCHDTEKAVDVFLSDNPINFIEKCCYRLDSELHSQYEKPQIMYHFVLRGSWGWADTFSSNNWACGYKKFIEA